jgi:hypothetical protein
LPVTLRNRLSRYNRQSEADGLCIKMVQAKPGQVSKGRIALRRVRDRVPKPRAPPIGGKGGVPRSPVPTPRPASKTV